VDGSCSRQGAKHVCPASVHARVHKVQDAQLHAAYTRQLSIQLARREA
jgi:hypothetical protein